MKGNKRAGFSIIEGLLAVLVIVVLAGITFAAVYQHNRTKPADAVAGSTNQQTNTTTQPAPTVAYLIIKEWGIKLPLSDSIKDAYYAPSIGSSKGPDGQPDTMLIGLKSLDSSGCAATNTTAIAGIFRALPAAIDTATGKLITQEYPDGITIGNYFYAYGKMDTGTCKAPQATLLSVGTAFLSAQKGIVTATAAN